MRLFLYGSLLDPHVLATRSGDPALPGRCVPASLHGWRRVARKRGMWPTLCPARGAMTQGAVAEVGAAALRRLIAYEGADYRLARVVVRCGRRSIPAAAWIAGDGGRRPWRFSREDILEASSAARDRREALEHVGRTRAQVADRRRQLGRQSGLVLMHGKALLRSG
ncbi:MAG TPA: gamma-glutamylcyclotransferase family protein [Acetobacteraceae bacterium]|nr:gamma-glutamylcyclotransferase family protein [Acetobacteraceae bacterium]